MSHICPQCSHIIPASSAFCTQCGYRLQGNEQVANGEGPMRRSESLANLPPQADPSATFTPGGQYMQPGQFVSEAPSQSETPPLVETSQPQANQASYAPVAAPQKPAASAPPPFFGTNPPQDPHQSFYAQGGYQPQPMQQQGGYQPQPMQQPGGYPPAHPGGPGPYMYPQYTQPPAQTNSGTMFARAYAGQGTPIHHQSWLFQRTETDPITLLTSLTENVQKQGVVGLAAQPEHLREQGNATTEERDVVKLQYGPSSIFVYITPIGQNLYVSRTSTIQQPLSQLRIFVLGGLAVLMLICFLIYALINPDLSAPGIVFSIKDFFFYASFGLLFFFLFLLIRSAILWITEKDFLVYLRSNILSDFTLDTLMSAEQITDKCVRETLSNAGIKTEDMNVFSQSSSPRQAFHRI